MDVEFVDMELKKNLVLKKHRVCQIEYGKTPT